MPIAPPRLGLTLALACLTAVGCTGKPTSPTVPTGRPDAKATAKPVLADALARATAGLKTRAVPTAANGARRVVLTGDARIVSDNGGGIVSDNGGGIVSDNGGGIISNNSGGVIANNGAGVVSNNGAKLKAGGGAGLTGATRGLLQAKARAEAKLADAIVTVHDAAGQVLVDAAGKPITATTDGQGAYRLDAVLPAENLVLRIKLWQGGTLSAMLPRDLAADAAGGRIDLDTASSIGAAYVLDRFVKGDRATYDKLPASEAARLKRELDAARALLKKAPKYDAAELVALGEDLREQVPAVGKALDDIKALLLGQASLGTGRRADEVPLASPEGIAVDATGRLLIGERALGRIRAVAPDGTVTTWADTAFGVVRQNFYELRKLAHGPGGVVYAFTKAGVFKIAADGTVGQVALPVSFVGSAAATAGQPVSSPSGIAVADDGTLYVAIGGEVIASRLIAVAPDGSTRDVPLGGTGDLKAFAIAPDGRLVVLRRTAAGTSEVWRGGPEGLQERVADGFAVQVSADLAVGPDGSIFVSTDVDNVLTAIAPDGTRRVIAGASADTEAGRAITYPKHLHRAPDGTLYLVDSATAFVHARTPAGVWRLVAGSHARIQDLARGEVTVNGPGGAVFDGAGRLVFTEVASNTVKRFDGQRIETVAGTVGGFAGDGGPAVSARLAVPATLAVRGDDLFVLDAFNDRLRKIGGDGIISTVAGPASAFDGAYFEFKPGVTYGDHEFAVAKANAIAADRAGRLVWAMPRQIARLGTDGRAQLLAGQPAATPGVVPDLGTLFAAVYPMPALEAPLARTVGVAVGPDDVVYFSDTALGRVFRIREAAGQAPVVEPVAGLSPAELFAAAGTTVSPSEGPDALAFGLALPAGICFDAAGNLYVAELGTANLPSVSAALGSSLPIDVSAIGLHPPRVVKITPSGRVTTVAGPGGKFFTDPKAEDALVLPTGLAASADGRLAILDAGANLIRILPAGSF